MQLGDVGPARARHLAEVASRRLDAATDPLAFAVLQEAEAGLAEVPRLSGLGGEVVRGFYYLPAPMRGFGRDRRVARLARWRMFPNEAVPDGVIHPRLREGRRAPLPVARLQRRSLLLHPPLKTRRFYACASVRPHVTAAWRRHGDEGAAADGTKN